MRLVGDGDMIDYVFVQCENIVCKLSETKVALDKETLSGVDLKNILLNLCSMV
jgi:hypothetical protein